MVQGCRYFLVWSFFTPRQKPEGYCNDHRVCVCLSCPCLSTFTLFTLQVAIQIGSSPNLVWWLVIGWKWCLLLDFTVRWSQPFWSIDFYLKIVIFHIFYCRSHNSNWIFAKLGMMIGYRLGMMPIVGFYGPVITAVLVQWFLLEIRHFLIFSTLQVVIQVGSRPNLI